MNNAKFNQWFKIYLVILFFFATFFLYQKYNNSVEWTISEWLINYQGGFTRRGLIGELAFQFSNLFSISVRESILIFQITAYLIYYFLLYKFLKNINKNLFLVFAIFSPLFIIYPIAEVEALARKEIFIFISFLLIANIFGQAKIKTKYYFYFAFILSTTTLIWEGIIFYLPFFIFILIIKNNFVFDKSFLIKLILSIFPVFLILYFIIFFKFTETQIKIMCDSINECYGAITYLDNSLKSNIYEVTSKLKSIYIIRYILIFFVGFFPLLILIKNSKFVKTNLTDKNFLPLFILIFLPNIFFYYIAQDWGRWINISYTLSLLLYLYLLKNNFIKDNHEKVNLYIFKNKFLLTLLFFIFSFGWSPKVLVTEDVGSIPIIRKSLIIIKYSFFSIR